MEEEEESCGPGLADEKKEKKERRERRRGVRWAGPKERWKRKEKIRRREEERNEER